MIGMSSNRRFRMDGFSLTELVVATVIFSAILTLGVIATNKNIRSIMGKSRQEQALSSIKQYSSSMVALQKSISLNPTLNGCVKDLSQRCNQDWTPFDLYRPSGTGLVAGDTWGEVMLNTESSAPCVTGTKNCALSALAEYRISGETLETRVTIRNMLDSKQKAAFSEPTSFQINRFAISDSCNNPFQAMVGIDEDGKPICEDMSLPAGGGGPCGPGEAVGRINTNGRAICRNVPNNVDTTANPPGFFVNHGSGQFGWASCNSISELNGVFPEARAKFVCNWQTNGPCTIERAIWVSQTCQQCSTSCSGSPQVCTTSCWDVDCSYRLVTGVESQTCFETTNKTVRTTGDSQSFSCKEIDPGGCSTIALGPYDSMSCPCFKLASSSGEVGCFR